MFVDSSAVVGSTLHADIVIIGSGAAGLAVASELDRAGASVIVIETGGYEHDASRRGIDRGEWIGEIGVGIGSRKRFLGGSTNCWGGHTSPMDPIGYERRSWVPNSGWPIDGTVIDPYQTRANELLRVGFDTYDVDEWRQRLSRVDRGLLLEASDRVETKLFQRSRVARFGELQRRTLDASPNTTVLLNSQVVELRTTDAADRVTGVRVVGTDAGPSSAFSVEGSQFVLCAGIENSRLLLASRREIGGLGNHHDQVGRYFMGHFHFVSGRLEPSDALSDPSLYTIPGDVLRYVDGTKTVVGALRISPEVQRAEEILDAAAFLLPYRPHEHWMGRSRAAAVGRGTLAKATGRSGPSFGVRDVIEGSADVPKIAAHGIGEAVRRARGKQWFGVRTWAEQAPDPENRLMLGAETDRFGLPRIRLRSNLTDLDKRTLTTGNRILAEEIEAAGLGRMVDELPTGSRWPKGATGTSHFMGGTRMHPDPSEGVVDENCRVHGIDNLFVGGASTFPASGLCMATYQLILLALRLADHLGGDTRPTVDPVPTDDVVIDLTDSAPAQAGKIDVPST